MPDSIEIIRHFLHSQARLGFIQQFGIRSDALVVPTHSRDDGIPLLIQLIRHKLDIIYHLEDEQE
jgi:hypothetical protein